MTITIEASEIILQANASVRKICKTGTKIQQHKIHYLLCLGMTLIVGSEIKWNNCSRINEHKFIASFL